jgi:hypothetical protein
MPQGGVVIALLAGWWQDQYGVVCHGSKGRWLGTRYVVASACHAMIALAETWCKVKDASRGF